MPVHCICAKNWEACPMHDWERTTGTHMELRQMEAKAQREIRLKRRLMQGGRVKGVNLHVKRSAKNRMEF